MTKQTGTFLLLFTIVGVTSAAVGLRQREADLPVHVVNNSAGWADESACIACHQEAARFGQTGHARTLLKADDADSRARLRALFDSPDSPAKDLKLIERDGRLWAQHLADETTQQIPLDFCFGSGLHAQTWVGILDDSWGATDLVEFRWTWYHDIDDFALTPGQPQQPNSGYFGQLGLLYDHPKARRCFACHATILPSEQGRIQFDHIQAGVTCQRCHGPRQEHLETEGLAGYNSWAGIDHVEAVYRCAECHRRPEDLEGQPITPDNTHLARFQPVGLMESACFRSPKMTCTICHDPHLPLAEQKLDGIWQCTQCHDGVTKTQPLCSAGHDNACVECHMPKVRDESPLQFTDHWIRKPDPEAPAKASRLPDAQ